MVARSFAPTPGVRNRTAESLIILAASLSIASPLIGSDWSWLEATCAAFDRHELAHIEETGTRATVEPAHLPAIEAMIAVRQACRDASLVEVTRSFAVDPRAHAHGSAR